MSRQRTVEQELGGCVLSPNLTRAQSRAVLKVLRGGKPNAAEMLKIFAATRAIEDALDRQARGHILRTPLAPGAPETAP